MKVMVFRLTIALLLSFTFCGAQEIIPLPNRISRQEGALRLPAKITLSSTSREFSELIPLFQESARGFYGLKIKQKSSNGLIRLVRDASVTDPEGYKLTVTPDRITIAAGQTGGCFYGLQSLMQLLNPSESGGKLPVMVIEDQPRYPWRGMMLDESRHFMGMEEVKRLLDWMALHKLNKFHWHLTDASGWRIEIRHYPLLTLEGGKGNQTDPEAPAKFYTQPEIREIVKYAGERFIEVIPEIDMPGHATAAVRAYPEFSGGGSARYPDFTFNPGKEGTYSFLTNILREITGLFPSSYIHIGGDEVHFGNEYWNHLPEVRQLMEVNHLKNLTDVEHYFLKRMSDSIRVLGKRVIGWDEVVTAGLPADNTLVMWWRHDKPQMLESALKNGYEVVLCPRIPFYFDFVQHASHASGRKWAGAYAPVESVYGFPDPELYGGISLTSPLIKGIQANVWTETIHTPQRLQFMLYPRLSALAEAAWTEEKMKNPENFFFRMNGMFSLYQRMGVTFFDYRHPEISKEIKGPGK